MNGKVFLVGAGPGDAGLLTRRAADVLEQADVVAIDALVGPDIAALIPSSARVIHVGKRASAHTLPQSEINALLIDEARKGHRVVRLKGGDPFVFGRGGEEAEDLANAGVPFEVVPGISSAIAGPAYAGIPVTHRQHATAVTLVTGHESEGTTGVEWAALAKLHGTIVFLMGLSNLGSIVQNLTSNGVPEERAVAVISNATRPDQITVTGQLADIEARVRVSGIQAPAIIVVGEVVRVRESIQWFENRPLFGRRVVVTRARSQSSQLRALLEASGAQVLEFPTIAIEPPESFESLDHAQQILRSYRWVVFTSGNGVRSFFERLGASGGDARALAASSVAAVGDATAAELRAHGIVADLVPERFTSKALLEAFPAELSGMRILIVRAASGSEDLIDGLRERGAEVDLAIAYRTVPVTENAAELRRLIGERSIDAVTFTSASTVESFFAPLTDAERSLLSEQALMASIGPVTTAALVRALGRQPDVEAPTASISGLHDAVVDVIRGRSELSAPEIRYTRDQ